MNSLHCASAAAIVVSVAAITLPHGVQAQEVRKPFNIAAGPAANAVAEFARQSGITVLASGEHLAGVTTNEVRGTFHALEALDKLLAGTGLNSKVSDSGGIFISQRPASPAVAPPQQPARTPAPVAAAEPAEASVVVVSGTRQGIISSIESKKLADTVSDAIIADDIGQFPDKNIAEAMSRVTGVQLSYDFGEGNQISIRGVQPDLNRIEINGLSVLSTSDAATRSPELRELPSELIKAIEVVKGVTADTTEGGIGGTVKIRTNKPLDFKKFTFAATTSAERNSLRGGVQPRNYLLIADQFLDGKLGLMANVVYDKVLTQADRVRNTGWRFLRDWDMSAEKTVPSLNPAAAAIMDRNGCGALEGTNRSDCERQWYDYSPSVPRYGIWTRDHRRVTGEFTAQYKMSSELSAFASFQRFTQNSHFTDNNYQTELTTVDRLANAGTMPNYTDGVPSGGSCAAPDATATPAGVVVTKHHVTEYTVGSCVAVAGRGGNNAFSVSARDFDQRVGAYYRSAGASWRRGPWEAEGLLASSNAAYRSDTNFVGLTMNAPGMKVTLDSQGFPHFAFPAAATPDNAAAYTQLQFNYSPVEMDAFEDQLKLDLRYRTGGALFKKIALGVQGRKSGSVRYADGGYVLNAGSNLTSSADDLDVQSSNVRYTLNYDPLNPGPTLRPATVQPFTDANSKEIWVSSAQMHNLVEAIRGTSPQFLRGTGLSGFPSAWLTPSYAAAAPYFDTSAFTHALVRQAQGRDGNVYPQIPSYGVEERIRAAYLRLDFDHELLGLLVEGNVGLRYAGTRTRATGRYRVLQRIERSPGSPLYDDRQLSNAIVLKDSRYNDYLPSLNLAFWLSGDSLVLRTGYGKVMARPSLDRLNPNFICVIGSGKPQFGGDGVDNCTGGNPDLQPYRAANSDVSLEWYPRRDSQLSLAYFRKDIASAIQNNATVRKDLLGDGTLFDVSTTVNGPGAVTRGIELAGRTALAFLPGVLGGLGVDGSYTRMGYSYGRGAELVNPLDGSQLPFPGMSRTAYRLALWYDLGAVNARVAYSYRAGYYTGVNDSNTGNPLFAEPTGFLDAKLQLRINKHLSVSFEAKNLSNERTLTTAGASSRPNDYSWSGRRYFVGLGYMH